jgi:membrane protease subunit HflK
MLRPEADGYVLTADGNIIHARATVKFRITAPIRYTFGFSNVTTILTNVLNNALFYASSRMTADAALYKDKIGFRDTVIERVRAKVTELDLGITLEPSDVETKAPADVRSAFVAVNEAEQERSRRISDALGYRDQITSKALGEAGAIIARGVGSSNRLVTSVSAEARAFSDQLPEYLRDPGLFRDRLLAARMTRVMTNAQEKFFLPERPFGQSREMRLELSREPVKREAPPTR